MKKIMFIFGTRPEFIKLYPVIQEAKRRGNPLIIINTGQHKDMLDNLLTYFQLTPDYNLEIMNRSTNLSEIVSESIKNLDTIIKLENLVSS